MKNLILKSPKLFKFNKTVISNITWSTINYADVLPLACPRAVDEIAGWYNDDDLNFYLRE